MATYQFVVTSAESNFQVQNPKEVIKVLQAVGYEESELYEDNKIFIGSYGYKSIDETDTVILSKKTGKVVAVAVFDSEQYFDLNGVEITDEDKIEKFEDEDSRSYYKMFLTDYLQNQLVDDKQYIVLTESGYEKLRSAGAYTLIISKYDTFENSTYRFIQDTIEQIEKE